MSTFDTISDTFVFLLKCDFKCRTFNCADQLYFIRGQAVLLLSLQVKKLSTCSTSKYDTCWLLPMSLFI